MASREPAAPRAVDPAALDPASVPNEALATALCGPEDRAEQARLFDACFKKGATAEALAWRYDRNPHGASVSLVSRPPGGEGVCGYACNPRLAVAGGAEATLGETGDVMTHPDWRKRGIFSGLDVACMAETKRLGWAGVFGLPNRRSAHIFLKLGWDRVGTIRPWTFVLRVGPEARAERLREGRLAALRLPLDARRCRAGERRLRRAAGDAFTVRPLDAFPAEVEALSRAVERDFALMVRRDAAYLDWRFLRNPSGLHRALGVFDRDGAFAGYVVIQVPRAGHAVGYLVDVLAPDASARAAAVGAGLDALRAAGAAVVQATAVDGSWWNERLVEAGFLPPKPDNHLIVIFHTHAADHPVARAGRDAATWYLTDGDRDDETMG